MSQSRSTPYCLLISISNSSLNSNTILTDNVAATSSILGMETNFNGLTLTSLILKGMIAVNSLKKQEPTIQPEINRTLDWPKPTKHWKQKVKQFFFVGIRQAGEQGRQLDFSFPFSDFSIYTFQPFVLLFQWNILYFSFWAIVIWFFSTNLY